MIRYTESEAIEAVKHLAGWEVKNNALKKVFIFQDFIQAFGFMTKVALISESINHHPDWTNVYNKVTITLCTHDVNAITDKDMQLAAEIERLVMREV